MVGRFLITTAEKQTWKIEEPIVFLGDWCKLYKDKDSWEKLNYKTNYLHENNYSIKGDFKEEVKKLLHFCKDNFA